MARRTNGSHAVRRFIRVCRVCLRALKHPAHVEIPRCTCSTYRATGKNRCRREGHCVTEVSMVVERGTLVTTCGCGHKTVATPASNGIYGSDADFCERCGEGFRQLDERRIYDGAVWVKVRPASDGRGFDWWDGRVWHGGTA